MSILLALLMLIAIVAGFIWLISWQLSSVVEDVRASEQKVQQSIHYFRQYISTQFGISPDKQRELLSKHQSSSQGQAGALAMSVFNGLSGFLTDLVLVLVYIFLLSFYRGRLKSFVLRLVPEEDKGKASHTIQQARTVAQKYLSGLGMMIVCLWILYGIGFSIVGVKHALFFAILCGVLEIVPFVGNLTGTALTVIMSLTQGGGIGMAVSIVAVYAVVQFLQTYILEPLVVGSEVNINPLFTIVAIVVGEMIWGIPGMILAIPLMGVAKIIFDHVVPLKPYGYLIGEDKKEEGSLITKLKGLFK